jgi:hypothetical protein
MEFRQTASASHEQASRRLPVSDRVRSAAVVVVSAACIVGIAFGAMVMLTSPDGWVMKAANQAVMTAQQGTLASYDIAESQ